MSTDIQTLFCLSPDLLWQIGQEVEAKQNYKKVLKDINKFGEVLDYEMNDRLIDNEYKQYRFFTDCYWYILLEVLEDIDVLENHFQTPDNRMDNNFLFECEVRFYDFYESTR